MKHSLKSVLISSAGILFALIVIHAVLTNPYRGSLLRRNTSYPPAMDPTLQADVLLTEQQVRQDLKQAHRLVRSRHPIWLVDPNTAEKVDCAFETALQSAAPMTVEELYGTLRECLAGLEDPHSNVYFYHGEKEPTESNQQPFVSCKLMQEENLGVFTLRQCIVNEVFGSTLESFFTGIRENGISNVVLDLRGNGGGNTEAALLFLEYLDVESIRLGGIMERRGWKLREREAGEYENNKRVDCFSGTLYVLTDRNTYSSAMQFAELLADNDIAVHVGQAPSLYPDHYGDLLCFRLKHSGFRLDVSHKLFTRIDRSKSGEPLQPDHLSDEPMETVLQIIKRS